MMAASESVEIEPRGELFDVDGPSPLPVIGSDEGGQVDAISAAERRITVADGTVDTLERIEARLALSDAWLAHGGIAPALEGARQALTLAPDAPPVLERLGRLLARSGAHGDAARVFATIAKAGGQVGAWLSAARSLARAEENEELEQLVAEMLQQFPEDLAVLRFAVEVARALPSNPLLPPRLIAASKLALLRGDELYSRRCAVDAWIESKGAVAGEAVGQTLAHGDARAAFVFAIDAATRVIASAGPVQSAAVMFAQAAQAARAMSSLPAEIAALASAAMLGADRSVREALRDLLAESGRVVDLAARLRSDARRETDMPLAAAAWKGVAAVETAEMPGHAAHALCEALVREPGDAEALAQLTQLAANPETEAAVRDGLFWASRAELPRADERRVLLTRLGEMERAAGDPASAAMAYSRAWKLGDQGALAMLETVSAEADALFAAAESALRAVENAPREARTAAVDELLAVIVPAPGAVRDLAQANRVLGPLAGGDERVAPTWLRITRRLGDEAALTAALRRISTRSTARQERARAAIELAGILDAQPEGQSEAIEVLQQLLDEQPGVSEAAAALAAAAEHGGDASLGRAAVLALARVEPHPVARDAFARLGGETPAADSAFAPVFRALDEAPGLRERADALRDLIALLGDSPSLLARRTRALLAQPSTSAEGLESARRFVDHCPLSPEATIAWFGAAGIVGDPDQLADAAVSVVHSLATARDAASVARAAIARLFALGEPERAIRVAREAAEHIGLADRALRGAVVEYALQQRDATLAAQLLEAAVAGAASAPGEQLANLRRVAAQHRARGDAHAESYALRRLLVHAPADRETLQRLSVLLPSAGDERALSRVLSLRLASETDRAGRRDAYLTLAAVQAHTGDVAAATVTLDRYLEEQDDTTRTAAQSEVVRALLALGAVDAAVERVTRWAEAANVPAVATAMYTAAVTILREHGGDASRMLGVIRAALLREPESPELIILAEATARKARAVGPMLEIYSDLHASSAGEHGRRALAYRRAGFLENVGEPAEALEAFRSLFQQTPTSGALRAAILRLAEATNRPDVLVDMFRKLGDSAQTNDAKIEHYLEAAAVARDRMHDRRAALELALLAHDVKRDGICAKEVVEIARSLKSLDPNAARAAVETVVDRTIEVADEVWDEQAKRDLSLRALEIAAAELNDLPRCTRAVEVHFKGAEDKPAARETIESALVRVDAPQALRDALVALPVMRSAAPADTAPAPRDPRALDGLREQIELLARSDRPAALAKASEALGRNEDEALRALTEELAREVGDASAELSLLDWRLDRVLDNRQRLPMVLRGADLLKGPLERPAEARRRLELALAAEPEQPELLRALHDVAEQLGAWDAVSTLLATRIARASDRAEIRALRLHRAAVLEQRLDDSASARAELEAILEDEPAHRAALRYLADLHLRDGQFREAGECFSRAAATTQVRSEAAELLAASGEAFAKGDDDVAADVQVRRAIELDPRSLRALTAFSNIARKRGDWGSLERTVLALEESAETDVDRVALRMAAARAALEAGALHRARSHLDSVRRSAPPDQVAALDAVLQEAHDNDRPISRPDLRAVIAPPVDAARATPVASEPDPQLTEDDGAAPGRWLQQAPSVPQTIDPADDRASDETPEADVAIPLVARRPSVPATAAVTEARATPPPAKRPTEPSGEIAATSRREDPVFAEVTDDELRTAAARGDADAMATLATRLARGSSTREEAARLERQRFNLHPSRLDALEALVGLYRVLHRSQSSRAVQTVHEVLAKNAFETSPPPPLAQVPEPPSDVATRMLLPTELHPVAEIGAILWDGLGNRYRREIASYGVTGVDRVALNGTTEISRVYTAAVRVLQLARHGVFVRPEVPGGAMAARTQPPSVVLATPLASDSAAGRFVLGAALEASRPSYILVSTLDPEERGLLVRAVGIAGSLVMTGAAPASARLAQELLATLSPRTQRRLEDLLRQLETAGTPFTEERWQYAMEIARARAGLLVSGDFGVAARMVVARHRGGGEPDVRGALDTLEPLRDLARFAVSEQYLAVRWYDETGFRTPR